MRRSWLWRCSRRGRLSARAFSCARLREPTPLLDVQVVDRTRSGGMAASLGSEVVG